MYEKYSSLRQGGDLAGSGKGATLLHYFYESSRYGDETYYRAAPKRVLPMVESMTPGKMGSVVPKLLSVAEIGKTLLTGNRR